MPSSAQNQGASNATFGWRILYHSAKLHVCEVCTAFEYLQVIRYIYSTHTTSKYEYITQASTSRYEYRAHTSTKYDNSARTDTEVGLEAANVHVDAIMVHKVNVVTH